MSEAFRQPFGRGRGATGLGLGSLLMLLDLLAPSKGVSVQFELVGPQIVGNFGFPRGHREFLLRLVPAELKSESCGGYILLVHG